jgi:DME family drug/metabolite transporter
MHPRHGIALVLAAAVLWGSTGTAQELGAPDASTRGVGAVRLVLGAAALTVIAAVGGGFRPTARIPPVPVVAMALGIALYQVTFFAAVRRSGVALGTVVAIGSAPLLTGMIVWLLTRRRPSRRWMVSTFGAIAGVTLISDPAGVDLIGVVLALGAGASYATYAVAAERLVKVVPATGAMALGFGGGALLMIPVLWSTDLSWLASRSGAVAALWLGLATTALAYVLFGTGLRSTPVATVATLSLAEPVTAFVLGVTVVGERPTTLGWVGAAVVMLALAGLNRGASSA